MNSRREKLYPNMSDEVSEAINLLLSSDVFPTGRVEENRFEVVHTRFKFVGCDGGGGVNDCVRRSVSSRDVASVFRGNIPFHFFSLIQL